jgi:hypothetical protein
MTGFKPALAQLGFTCFILIPPEMSKQEESTTTL